MPNLCPWCGAEPSTSQIGWQCGSWIRSDDVLGKEQTMLCQAWQLRKRVVRLEALMQEAFENCETCRGETDSRRCARCITFRKALDKEPGDELPR